MNAYRISHYTILAKLGAGGMGEVYKAHDTILDRPVALKILPLELMENADRLRRFIQEAKSASALNHPHIITIYEVGEARAEVVEANPEAKDTNAPTGDLVSVAREKPIQYIAMEFIEGETLSAKIHRDQTNLRKLLGYLVQTADGLTKAHAAGIVHRDLKPDNVMINGDGYAKILDFGLAKLVEPPPPANTEQDSDEVATAILNRSQPGAVMGTIGYMSPEQALGRTVDQRSDIFAFGCILYEIVTGRKPFAGDSMVDSLHKIIYMPAAPVKDFNQNCPYEIQRIIRRCLAKDPEDRYQRIKDIATDLHEFLEESKAVSGSGVYSGIPSLSQSSGEMLLDAPLVETQLDESTPAVLQLSRFSKASVALAVLALIAAIAVWPLHQRGSIGSELKLDYSKEAAMSKAREVVNGLGYNANNLEVAGRFIGTGFDLKNLTNKEGRGAARQAVREGKTGIWQFMFASTSDDASGGFNSTLRPGQMLVMISPQGQVMSFSTAPEESGDITAVDQNRAVSLATEQTRRWLSFDPAGYNIEVVPRSSPPGLTEVTWRNSTPVLGHKETVRVNIQGTKVTRLSRQFDAPQSVKEASAFADAVTNARSVLLILAVVVLYVFGVVFLIYSKRWQAFGRKISIVAALLFGLGWFSLFYFQANSAGSSLFLFLGSLVTTLLLSVAFFPSGTGFFEWLHLYNPARLFALEQIIERRFFSPSVSSALVHGVLGGTLLLGLSEAGAFMASRIPGATPAFSGEIEMINGGWPIITGIAPSIIFGLMLAGGIALLVEFSERVIGHGVLASVVPALLIAIALTSYLETRWILIALSFVSGLVICLLTFQLYRRYGFATVWLALSVNMILATAVRTHYLKDPGFVWQSNLLLVVVGVLLIAGIWGYTRRRLRTTLSSFAVNRG
jgi:serine/threonine protein kinase